MIGVLGGTFDPIHYGHLRTALDVQQALGLREIRLIPLRDPPHRGAPVTEPKQRLEMVRAAVVDEPRIRVDDREVRRAGKSYTLDTLISLREELGHETLCLLMGSDAFQGFSGWHRPGQILDQAHLIVMSRPGTVVTKHYLERIAKDPGQLRDRDSGLILIQPVTRLEISATRIRELINSGLSPRYLLPDAVLGYIERFGLYR